MCRVNVRRAWNRVVSSSGGAIISAILSAIISPIISTIISGH